MTMWKPQMSSVSGSLTQSGDNGPSSSWMIAGCLAAVTIWHLPLARGSDQASIRLFEQEIRPMLLSECIRCHGPRKAEGDLRLDSRDAMLRGGDSGPAIDIERPAESLILQALRYEGPEMPPDGPLPQRQVDVFARWIAAGAVWPDPGDIVAAGPSSASQWWAVQPLADVAPPTLPHDTWSTGPIDRFIFARLDAAGLTPAPPADRYTLVRRAYLDVLGIPPSPTEVQAFVNDPAPDAWERLVERLLDDPRYGEHWARYWLDLVRYAESDGWNADAYRPHIWRYRDYVIRSFNQDKPYPQFVLEQLAGDELAADDPEALTATGFLRLGIYEYNQRDARNHWNDIMNETTDVVADVFLGLSMACARCHDHKFDPILQEDYYSLRAFFEPLIWRDDQVAATAAERAAYAEQLARWEAATVEIRTQIDELLQPYYDKKWKTTVEKFPLDIQACFHMPRADRTSWQQQMAYLVERQFEEEGGGPLKNISKDDKARHEALLRELATMDHLKPAPLPPIMTVADFEGILAPTRIPDVSDGPPIPPRFPSAFQQAGAAAAALQRDAEEIRHELRPRTTGRRTRLAQWIGSPHNPLTPRVIVNRIWQHHFGRGIVDTPNDFGAQGAAPSHPELLDWLTRDFIDHGWKFKRLHKQILMSSTWRQSSVHPQASQYARIDPGEVLLWRWRVRRLRAEQIRDAMLVVSGMLETQVGGPSVASEVPRRSIYLKQFRNQNDTFLHGFDMANGLHSVAVRDATTTPLQALLMINGSFALDQARHLAERLISEVGEEPAALAERAFFVAWGRLPSAAEALEVRDYIAGPGGAGRPEDWRDRLVDVCHVLLNANQFLYVE
ncbi:MAG: DUF1549 domain-containing protein [Planctomycetota bacterium]|nr:MAG: DUF1549 domain-containing protein [Planctomycetota bacterium]